MTFKLNAASRLSVASDVIAPAQSFREKNERQLDRQQMERERNDNKSSDNETAVRDTKTKPETAARTPAHSAEDLPQNDVQYATTSSLLRLLSRKINGGLAGPEDDPLTHDMVNAKSTVDGDDAPGHADKFHSVNTEDNELRANGPTTALEDPEDFNLAPVEYLEDQPIDIPGDLALADADPKLWNLAEQPLGGIGG